MKPKIYGGTRSDGTRLCDTCRRAVIIKGPAISEEIVHCHAIDRQVKTHVAECNQYDDSRNPSLYEMQQIAWVVVTKGNGKATGFMSARDWRKQERDIPDVEVQPGFAPQPNQD